jgi:hypothetical protein
LSVMRIHILRLAREIELLRRTRWHAVILVLIAGLGFAVIGWAQFGWKSLFDLPALLLFFFCAGLWFYQAKTVWIYQQLERLVLFKDRWKNTLVSLNIVVALIFTALDYFYQWIPFPKTVIAVAIYVSGLIFVSWGWIASFFLVAARKCASLIWRGGSTG